MEELIKELESHYDRICAEEIFEIYQKADEYYHKINLVESCVQSSKFKDLKSKHMDKTVTKLLAGKKTNMPSFEELTKITKFDQEHYYQYEKEVREQNPERTEILFDLQSFLKFFKSGEEYIFVEFDVLKKIFNYLHISAYKQVRAFVEIIETNGFLGIGKTELFLPDYDALINHEYQHLTTEEVRDILSNEKLEEFLLDENSQNPLGQIELLECLKDAREDYTDVFLASLELDRLFSTKAYDLTEDDYKKVQEKMDFLSFGDIAGRVIRQMKTYANTYAKEKKANKESKIAEKSTTPKKETNLNQTIREINRYFELDTKILKEFLSLDQIIYVLSLMYSINITEDTIESFLRSAMRELKGLHPYALYNQAYDKFIYLGQENPDVQEHLDMIEYILSENSIFICPKEKYIETKRLIEEEMNEIIRLTNGNYTYEMDSAKKLCKENEE